MRRSPVRSVARNGVDMVSLAPDRRTLVDSHRLQLHGERVIVHPPLHSAQPAAGQDLRVGAHTNCGPPTKPFIFYSSLMIHAYETTT